MIKEVYSCSQDSISHRCAQIIGFVEMPVLVAARAAMLGNWYLYVRRNMSYRGEETGR